MYRKLLTALLVSLLSACSTNSLSTASFDIEMNEFGYAPSSIEVKVGQPVKLTITNDGLIEHDFVVEKIDVSDVSATGSGVGEHHMNGEHVDYDLHVSTSAGGTSILRFIPNKAGVYKIFCSVIGHKEAGMIGELIVSE